LQPKINSEEDSIFLSDFGSLEEINAEDDIDEVVKSQMKILEEAIGGHMDAPSSPAQRKRKGLSGPPSGSTKARLGNKD